MRLAGRRATFFLSEDGKDFYHRVDDVPKLEPVTVDVEETDDVGVWIREWWKTDRHVLLLRWEFILGIELPVDSGNVVGLRG